MFVSLLVWFGFLCAISVHVLNVSGSRDPAFKTQQQMSLVSC